MFFEIIYFLNFFKLDNQFFCRALKYIILRRKKLDKIILYKFYLILINLIYLLLITEKDSNFKYNYKEKDYIDILKHSSFNSKTEDEINEFINVNLKSLDRINIDKGEDK